jgi:hypothetical protein
MPEPPPSSRPVEVPGVVAGPARLRLRIPSDWACVEVPLALVAVHRPEPVDEFWVHGVLDRRTVAPSVDLLAVADATTSRLRARDPQLAVRSDHSGRFGDRVVHLRGISLATGDPVRPTAQLHGLVLLPAVGDRSVRDLVTFVGSCPESSAETFVPQFVDIVASIEAVPPSPSDAATQAVDGARLGPGSDG